MRNFNFRQEKLIANENCFALGRDDGDFIKRRETGEIDTERVKKGCGGVFHLIYIFLLSKNRERNCVSCGVTWQQEPDDATCCAHLVE